MEIAYFLYGGILKPDNFQFVIRESRIERNFLL
jgi:hypothetical protein